MNATQELRAEHDGILMMLRILDRICSRMDSGNSMDLKHLEGIVEFLRVFADRCHHGKEEDILFPAMEKAGIPRQGGPIGQMLHEHDRGRGCIQRMSDALEKMQGGDEGPRSSFCEAAREYSDLLKNHISKENEVLFPMAEKHLPQGSLEGMTEDFEKIETDRIGVGKHEEFHRMMDELAGIYLK